jgi:hypothetical protein
LSGEFRRERELRERYERDYRVLTAASSRAALTRLEEIAAAGEDIGEGGATVRMVHELFAAERLTPLRR